MPAEQTVSRTTPGPWRPIEPLIDGRRTEVANDADGWWHVRMEGVGEISDRGRDAAYERMRGLAVQSPVAEAGDLRWRVVPDGRGRWVVEDSERGLPWNRCFAADNPFQTREEAVADVRSIVRHRAELAKLPRRDEHYVDGAGPRTPWGRADHKSVLAPGVVYYGTPSHAGFHLSEKANMKVHPAMRAKGGWYEGTNAAGAVTATFPDLFTARQRAQARRRFVDVFPREWEAATGERIGPEESSALRREAFSAANADRWIVVSASTADGRVVATAVLGGRRPDGGYGETRTFAVDPKEYRAGMGEFGFVIDEARHEEITDRAPSPGM